MPASMNAQVKQEVGVFLGGGLSSLNYDGVSSSLQDRMGFTGGFSYMYFLTNNWAVKSGLELSYYHAETDINSISGWSNAIDNENQAFEYQYKVGGYREKQNSYIMNIPVMLSFQTDRSNATTNFYVSGGFKLGIPVSNKYKSEISSIKTQGYYPDRNVTLDDLYFAGFGTYADRVSKDGFSTNIQVMTSLEAGIKNKIGDNLYIYSGLYFDYGLNSLAKKNKNFIEYNNVSPNDILNNSVLNSKQLDSNNNSVSIVDKVHPIAFGIKVNVAFEL